MAAPVKDISLCCDCQAAPPYYSAFETRLYARCSDCLETHRSTRRTNRTARLRAQVAAIRQASL